MTVTVLRCSENLLVRLNGRLVLMDHAAFARFALHRGLTTRDFPLGRAVHVPN